jgi:hypothetical protein
LGLAGCSKAEQPPLPAAVPIAVPSSEPLGQSSTTPEAPQALQAPEAPAAAMPNRPAGAAPTSFKGGSKETIGSAVGLGCEATSLDGWLKLLCRKKNGTGGHPVRAIVHNPDQPAVALSGQEPGAEPAAADAQHGEELTANEQGELTIVVPYSGDEKRDVNLEWTDTSYTLHVTGSKATFEWAASGIPHRRACHGCDGRSRFRSRRFQPFLKRRIQFLQLLHIVC